jgi:hypothetical protein
MDEEERTMFGPMTAMTERTRIHNEQQLNAAPPVTYMLPKASRFAALKLTLRRMAARHQPVTAPEPCCEQA